MKSDTSNPSIPLRALPSFFKDAAIVSSAQEDFQSERSEVKRKILQADERIESKLVSVSSQELHMNSNARKIYQSNDFSKIEMLEKKMDNDLTPIYDNIKEHCENAWTRVVSQGKEFYMCWSNTGSMWAYTPTIEKSQNGTTFQASVNVGTYSQSSGVLSSQSYTFSITSMIGEVVLSAVVVYALSKAIQSGVEFLVSRFAADIVTAAANLGFQRFSCTVLSKVVTGLACCVAAVIVTIGIHYLWEWLVRRYIICLRIYNWDEQNDWKISGQYLGNAVVAGGGEQKKNDAPPTIPKKVKPGGSVTPPGFQPSEALDEVCYYAIMVWENRNQFLQGCSMALSLQKDGSNEGFMWAFDCPRIADNRQAARDGIGDPKDYIENCQWDKSPKDFHITATSQNIPVSFGLNKLSGAENNLYEIKIQINH